LKLPRDVNGHDLVRALARFGYGVTRQTGSHVRLTSHFKGSEHHVTIPAHNPLRIGTLSQILSDVSAYLEIEKDALLKALFGQSY
jgi:predicted RNA binding protein YcfA (HicA-like mRNA interferase family)